MLNQMALMMKAGVSLIMAMDVMIDGQKDRTFKKILLEMKQDLLSGMTVSASMTKFRAFPEMIVSMIQSGEENGRLDTAFERCASIQEGEMTLTSKLRSAMIYPCILLFLTVVLMIVMNTLVLPSFAGIFKQFGASLPALTQGVLAVSDFHPEQVVCHCRRNRRSHCGLPGRPKHIERVRAENGRVQAEVPGDRQRAAPVADCPVLPRDGFTR